MIQPPDPEARRLLLVTGMSGAGKSTVLDALEDLGWDCVDNLPADMVGDFVARAGAAATPSAVGMDVRSRGFDPLRLPDFLAALPGVRAEILFLDCSDRELARRFDKSRRRHPLAPDRTVEEGITRERNVTARLRAAADRIVDTSDMSPVELREELRRTYGDDILHPQLTIASFGFGRGISRTADLVFDMRFIDNPHWIEELRGLTGRDAPVQAHVAADPGWAPTMERIETLLADLIPRYWAAGKYYLSVGFGCTGGRHRSVAAAEEMAKRLQARGFPVMIRHRDLASPPSDAIEDRATRQSGDSGGV